ncbi:hypothetical protein LMG31884_47750 (plasmid) [Xanthomonas hydrangeae]|nr:hypothetical protein LMG31884_47750 [Xanthomonas hydrangeae]CAD7741479.1 hypothetical protein LMG31884_47750 [Xanthomonas hydrangeae]CAD7747874.1 hypothetical protein LMG31887_46080 [Xanthomonas hydrangeae]CAD7747875.1 hypothetical protein LMG31887_46080 [Xanthomonas hydrangeae]CAD7748248.1 hypothetical protein LMG31885_45410 [Xanthomonas hydrangeae]
MSAEPLGQDVAGHPAEEQVGSRVADGPGYEARWVGPGVVHVAAHHSGYGEGQADRHTADRVAHAVVHPRVRDVRAQRFTEQERRRDDRISDEVR